MQVAGTRPKPDKSFAAAAVEYSRSAHGLLFGVLNRGEVGKMADALFAWAPKDSAVSILSMGWFEARHSKLSGGSRQVCLPWMKRSGIRAAFFVLGGLL